MRDTLSYHFRRDELYSGLAHRVKNIISANIFTEYCPNSNENIVARRVVTFARNRSRRTIREFAIIIISPVDTAIQRIQIVT